MWNLFIKREHKVIFAKKNRSYAKTENQVLKLCFQMTSLSLFIWKIYVIFVTEIWWVKNEVSPDIMINNFTCNFIKKETLAQVFSCEFCKISKNTFLHRTPLLAASALRTILFVTENRSKSGTRIFSLQPNKLESASSSQV